MPMSVFVFEFRASRKCIRRNRNSSSCGPILTSLKNITSSPCAEEDRDLRMAEETAVLSSGKDLPVRLRIAGYRDWPVDSIAVDS